MSIPIHKNSNRPYKIVLSSNQREAIVMNDYYNRGWVVLKNGWPDLFCYNPTTKEIELVEVKAKSQLKPTKKGKSTRIGLSRNQLRMHQYLKKAGFVVKIVHIE